MAGIHDIRADVIFDRGHGEGEEAQMSVRVKRALICDTSRSIE